MRPDEGFDRPIYMKTIIIAAVACTGTAALVSAQSTHRAKVGAPERIAVAMRQGDQLSPFTVEATNTGWVSVSILSTRPDAGLLPPPFRLLAEARDVKEWATRARAILAAPQDSSAGQARALLGNGSYQIEILRQRSRPASVVLSVRTCGSGWGSSGPSIGEALDFVALLDSAASVAGGGEARPPTLSRPYYSSEVSCPAVAGPANQLPRAPHGTSASVPEVGAQFVVDTNGRVERRSIRILPGTPKSHVTAARRAIAQWTFRPAEVDGTPVRQVVQTSVGFQTEAHRASGESHAIQVEPTKDGWVHVYRPSGVNGNSLQQWFEPDSVDTWLDRMWGRSPGNEIAAADTARLLRTHGLLGPPSGVSLSSALLKTDSTLQLAVGFNGCAGAFNESGPLMGTGQVFVTASRAARSFRRIPTSPIGELYTARDVSCPAWLPWVRSTLPGFERVWRYPVVAYPASMLGTNAHAEVLISFVVDTTGVADPESIVVMPGSDARAAAAVPGALRELRFRAATRSGYKVRQRVIQTLRFEPPPVCFTRDASPACPRRYSKN